MNILNQIARIVPLLFLLGTTAAARGPWGIGLMLGEPTGITFKQWLGDRTAFDVAGAISLDEEASFQVHADYLLHTLSRTAVEPGGLPLYVGLGARALFDGDEDETRIGARAPVGLAWMFGETIEAFGEIVPIWDFQPEDEFELNAALGVRLFFR